MRFVCLLLLVVSAWAEKKPVTKLQIGVKKRIPAEDCPIKTRNGDNLHMVNSGLSGLRLSEFVQISEFFSIYITDICQTSESFAKSDNLK